MRNLISTIDSIVHDGEPAEARIAAALAARLGDPHLLLARYRQSSPDHYQANVVHVADDGSFSIVALVWLPGQVTPIHSHRSWCVVGIHEGEELEIAYGLDPVGRGVVGPTDERRYAPGDVTWLDAETEIHRVENSGDRLAISLHVYGLDYRRFAGSILDVYDPPAVLALQVG